jgi:membrane associated rhomboid family serine protease
VNIRYNAPVTLTFALISTCILAVDQLFGLGIIPRFFSIPGRGYLSGAGIAGVFRLFTHVAGHYNWTHLLSNFTFILLLGPSLEEKYGSGSILFMILATAFVTGILNILLFSTGLLGASGVVFMMILLISFTNIKKGDIPLTFILVVVLFLAREIINSFETNTISEFAHIMGGIIGSLFGFFSRRKH